MVGRGTVLSSSLWVPSPVPSSSTASGFSVSARGSWSRGFGTTGVTAVTPFFHFVCKGFGVVFKYMLLLSQITVTVLLTLLHVFSFAHGTSFVWALCHQVPLLPAFATEFPPSPQWKTKSLWGPREMLHLIWVPRHTFQHCPGFAGSSPHPQFV